MFGLTVSVPRLSVFIHASIALCVLVLPSNLLFVRAQSDCNIDCREVKCISGVTNQDSCPDGTFYQENIVACNCCPACVKFLSLNDKCDSKEKSTPNGYKAGESEVIIESSECAPGLKCEKKLCTIDEGKCFAYQYQKMNILKHYCESDGTFSAVQCKGDPINGRCFCYTKEGAPLFGSAWWQYAENMTCACSREVASVQETQERTDVSLHCIPDGGYEQLQCDDHLCWCAHFQTGAPLVEVVPETMMKLLPCYVEEPDKQLYLRECESIEISANRIKDLSRKHGNFMSMEPTRCDPDGSYGPVQILNSAVRCTRQDKTMIGSWQGIMNNIKESKCNCARDQEYYKELGLDFFLDCISNGNYSKIQSVGDDNTFCVDGDGYPTTNVGKITIEDCPKW